VHRKFTSDVLAHRKRRFFMSFEKFIFKLALERVLWGINEHWQLYEEIPKVIG
jgi:hypothetical protein